MLLTPQEARQRCNEIKPVYAQWRSGKELKRERIIAIRFSRHTNKITIRTFTGLVALENKPGIFDDGNRTAQEEN